jgi:peptide/nickel transport system substrate-binding protein
METTCGMPHPAYGKNLTRRGFLRRATTAVAVAAGASVLAACGSATAPTTTPQAVPTGGGTTAPGTTTASQVAAQAPAPTTRPASTVAPIASLRRGGILRNAEIFANDSLDPHLSSTRNNSSMQLRYDTLLSYQVVDAQKSTFEVKPALAESYSVVDPTTLEFKIRKGVKFHDGSDFNAGVAKWNLDRAATHPQSKVKETLALVNEVQAVDDLTLRILLKGPSSILPLALTQVNVVGVSMISKDAVEKGGEQKFASNPVGTGPMKFKEWIRDDRVVLEKFPGHWEMGADGQPLPYLDGYIGRAITDPTVALVELRAGNLDRISVDTKDLATVQANPALATHIAPGAPFSAYPGFYFNPRPGSDYPFSNKKPLREAAHYAVDRDSMAKALGFGAAQAAYYPYWFPGMPGYDESLPRRAFDLAKAKQLLTDAGYPNGVDIEVKVINRPAEKRSVEVLQGMWEKAGIRAKINLLDRLPWVDDGRSGKFEGLSHVNSSSVDPLLQQPTRTGSTYNWPGYSNPEMDKLWQQATAEYDGAKRVEIYKQIQKLIYDDAFHLIGYMYPDTSAISKKVQNLTLQQNYRYVWLGQ